ncbi:hypothetical protein SUGI_1077650 [Cryptomeria japonica]|nr:hypothetical protein SUGI_1077650 [Cryptomeria japonica]
MDTPVRLCCTNRQMSFLGNISEKRLKQVFYAGHGMVVQVVQRISGDEFLKVEHHYRVNTDTYVIFVASLIDAGEGKEMVGALCRKLIKKCYLGELEDELENVDKRSMIPLPMNFYVVRRHGKEVKMYPILVPMDEAWRYLVSEGLVSEDEYGSSAAAKHRSVGSSGAAFPTVAEVEAHSASSPDCPVKAGTKVACGQP